MKPQIRILEATGREFKLDLVWDKEDNSFELPSNFPNEEAEGFNFFWYFSDGSFYTKAKAEHVFSNKSNHIYNSGLLLTRKKKKGPIVKGKASPTPKPPVDPYDTTSRQIHVEAPEKKDSSQNGAFAMQEAVSNLTETQSALALSAVVQDNLVIAILKYTRLEEMAENAYLRVSMNRMDTQNFPLVLRQQPISFHGEWVDIASPSDEYIQAIQIGFENAKVGESRTIFLPLWGIYSEDDSGKAQINLDNELKIEWMEVTKKEEAESEDLLIPLEEVSLKIKTELLN